MQNQKPIKYPEYINSNPKSVTSGITLDVAIRNVDDDDISSKLYLPPQIVEEDMMTNEEDINDDHVPERSHDIRHRIVVQGAEDPEDVARYRMLQQRYQTLTKEHAANEEALRQGDVILNTTLSTPGNNQPGTKEEYPTFIGRFQEGPQITDGELTDEEGHLMRGIQEGQQLMRSLQQLSYDAGDDQEAHSNSRHENLFDEPEENEDPLIPSAELKYLAVDKAEKDLKGVPDNTFVQSARYRTILIPGCCFLIGIAVAFGILFALDFSETTVLGYRISFDATSSSDEEKKSSDLVIEPKLSTVPSASPSVQPTSSLDRGESAPTPGLRTSVPTVIDQSSTLPTDQAPLSEGSNTSQPTSNFGTTPSSAPSLRGTSSFTETPSHFPSPSTQITTPATINQQSTSIPVPPTNAPTNQVPTLQPSIPPDGSLLPPLPTLGPTTGTTTQNPTMIPSMVSTTINPTITLQWSLVGGPFFANEAGRGQGRSIAIAGSFMVSGEPEINGGVGQTNIYKKLDSWVSLYSIQEEAALLFGSALDMKIIDGKAHLLVGAKDTEDDGGYASFGSFSYYQLDDNGWSQVGSTIKPAFNLVESGGKFGGAVAMAQDIQRIVVGAPDSSLDGNNLDTGRVYTYEYNGSDWVSIAGPVVGNAESMLGTSLDISKDGNKMLVGAPQNGNGNGAVYFYEWDQDNGSWGSILPVPGGDGELLGTSVAILNDDATLIAFGGPGYGNNQGVIKVYADFGGVFFPMGEPIIGKDGEKIGKTLTGCNGTLGFGTDSGYFHVFALDGSSWSEIATGPGLGSAVVSIDMSEDAQRVSVGLASEESLVYELQ